jgi:Arc/MetJ family transcription regulator
MCNIPKEAFEDNKIREDTSMATNLNIDTSLLELAYRLSGLKTKRETVNSALKEYITHHRQKEMLKYFGKIDFDGTYNYKRERNRKIS